MPAVVYISIGNSDDRLTQAEWSNYWDAVDQLIEATLGETSGTLHGVWFSRPESPFQNACWAIEFDTLNHGPIWDLRQDLASLAHRYKQDSVAWAVAPFTEFLGAGL